MCGGLQRLDVLKAAPLQRPAFDLLPSRLNLLGSPSEVVIQFSGMTGLYNKPGAQRSMLVRMGLLERGNEILAEETPAGSAAASRSAAPFSSQLLAKLLLYTLRYIDLEQRLVVDIPLVGQ